MQINHSAVLCNKNLIGDLSMQQLVTKQLNMHTTVWPQVSYINRTIVKLYGGGTGTCHSLS